MLKTADMNIAHSHINCKCFKWHFMRDGTVLRIICDTHNRYTFIRKVCSSTIIAFVIIKLGSSCRKRYTIAVLLASFDTCQDIQMICNRSKWKSFAKYSHETGDFIHFPFYFFFSSRDLMKSK